MVFFFLNFDVAFIGPTGNWVLMTFQLLKDELDLYPFLGKLNACMSSENLQFLYGLNSANFIWVFS